MSNATSSHVFYDVVAVRSPTQLGARLVVLFAAQHKYAAQQLYVAQQRGCCAPSATQLGARLGNCLLRSVHAVTLPYCLQHYVQTSYI